MKDTNISLRVGLLVVVIVEIGKHGSHQVFVGNILDRVQNHNLVLM
jgi:hypothetical protein